MDNFFIITNQKRDGDLTITRKIEKYLLSRGKEALVHISEKRENGGYIDSDTIPSETECVIVVGGDGTLLSTARDISNLELPILGVNVGTLGFLADAEVSRLDESLDCLLNDAYEIEERMMLCGMVKSLEGTLLAESRALNDVILHTRGDLHIVDYRIYVNGKYLGDFRADGIIVCTPTGSTAYSMSAGGPIIEPKARMMVITPICPHTLNTRSIVLSAEDTVKVSVLKGDSSAHFDGVTGRVLEKGDYVEVRKSSQVTRIVRTNPDSFLAILSRKFST